METRVFINYHPVCIYGIFYSNDKEKFKIFKVGDQKLTEKEMLSYINNFNFKKIKIRDLKTKPLKDLWTPAEIAVIEMLLLP